MEETPGALIFCLRATLRGKRIVKSKIMPRSPQVMASRHWRSQPDAKLGSFLLTQLLRPEPKLVFASTCRRKQPPNWVRFYQSKSCGRFSAPDGGVKLRFSFAIDSRQRWMTRVSQQAPTNLLKQASGIPNDRRGRRMPLAFHNSRILHNSWGRPPGLRGSPWTRCFLGKSAGQAGQGAGWAQRALRGRPPHDLCQCPTPGALPRKAGGQK